jgi:hypothetical protein
MGRREKKQKIVRGVTLLALALLTWSQKSSQCGVGRWVDTWVTKKKRGPRPRPYKQAHQNFHKGMLTAAQRTALPANGAE